jgi:hydroxymethylpyrimidine/phosphomethylpyrimidine kinase
MGGPVLLVAIGGFDPTGGAGVVRDFLTAHTLGARPHLVPTAWTVQSAGMAAVHPVPPEALDRAVRAALDLAATVQGGRAAVKIGMLPDGGAAETVARALAGSGFVGPMVLDPVLAASSGGSLYRGDTAPLLALAARVTVVTPNAGEAAALSGIPVTSLESAAAAGQALLVAGASAVLVKGGHLAPVPVPGEADEPQEAVDLLVTARGVERFGAPRVPGGDVRGTGCALATALAVALARGLPLADAVAGSKAWLHARLQDAIQVGGERHLGGPPQPQ